MVKFFDTNAKVNKGFTLFYHNHEIKKKLTNEVSFYNIDKLYCSEF